MKSIFSKILSSYLIIVFLTTMVSGLLLSVLVRYYLIESKRLDLLAEGRELTILIAPMLQRRSTIMSLGDILPSITNVTGTYIWIMNKNGDVVFGPPERSVIDSNIGAVEWHALLSGQAFSWSHTRLQSNSAYIAAAVPMSTPAGVVGVIFITSPLTGISNVLRQVILLLLYSSGAALVVSTLLGYWLSRTIARPIEIMTDAAQKVSNGQFDVNVPVTSRDEVGRLAKVFNQMAGDLHQLEQMRRDFVANVSHELKTPLTTIQGYSEAMLDGLVEEENTRNKYLAIIRQEALRLHRLVNSLLDLSKLQAGHGDLKLQPLQLVPLLQETYEKVLPSLQKKAIQFTLHANQSVPPVMADRDRMQQILFNLLDNAIRYTPDGGNITVNAEAKGPLVMVEVKDSGPGIPDKDIHHIWERFYRVNKARSRNDGGTGLGLSIVRELVQSMGGSIRVVSPTGQGACFILSFPSIDMK